MAASWAARDRVPIQAPDSANARTGAKPPTCAMPRGGITGVAGTARTAGETSRRVVTAAASAGQLAPPIGAWTMGVSMPRRRQKRLVMADSQGGKVAAPTSTHRCLLYSREGEAAKGRTLRGIIALILGFAHGEPEQK